MIFKPSVANLNQYVLMFALSTQKVRLKQLPKDEKSVNNLE